MSILSSTRLYKFPDPGSLGKHTTGMMSSCSRALSTTSLMLSEPKSSSVALSAFDVPIEFRRGSPNSDSCVHEVFLPQSCLHTPMIQPCIRHS